ncbi:MAG: MoaD/ThiS family protein [Candidatus Bathyarchaeota archaeon]|nr:MAG: MoaD/ThiS family protein [Candidatus Bathyarchaeota archaeon]
MKVRVSYFGFLRTKFDSTSEDIQMSKGSKVYDLFQYLASRYGQHFKSYVLIPEKIEVRSDVLVNINDIPVQQIQGLETRLNDGDQIDILPLFTGGG